VHSRAATAKVLPQENIHLLLLLPQVSFRLTVVVALRRNKPVC
jgi:hypothetical protein